MSRRGTSEPDPGAAGAAAGVPYLAAAARYSGTLAAGALAAGVQQLQPWLRGSRLRGGPARRVRAGDSPPPAEQRTPLNAITAAAAGNIPASDGRRAAAAARSARPSHRHRPPPRSPSDSSADESYHAQSGQDDSDDEGTEWESEVAQSELARLSAPGSGPLPPRRQRTRERWRVHTGLEALLEQQAQVAREAPRHRSRRALPHRRADCPPGPDRSQTAPPSDMQEAFRETMRATLREMSAQSGRRRRGARCPTSVHGVPTADGRCCAGGTSVCTADEVHARALHRCPALLRAAHGCHDDGSRRQGPEGARREMVRRR